MLAGQAAYVRYVQAFERKWIRDAEPTGDSQLGTSDLQSLAETLPSPAPSN